MIEENKDKEVWKDIPEYEGHYQVSNHGRFKSFKIKKEGIILKGGISTGGYKFIRFPMNKCKYIHQLIAITFLNHTPCGHKIVVDHINGDKSDNHVSNLQLISQRKNSSKDRNKGTSIYTGVHYVKDRGKWGAMIMINGKVRNLGNFKLEEEARDAYQNKLKEITNT